MFNQKEKSTFLIRSKKNKSFGTGFCIDKDKNGSFIVTCAHVVDECGHNDMLIDGIPVQIKAKGNSLLLDLAVLYVERLTDSSPLNAYCSETLKNKPTPFSINGFRPHKKESYKLETICGEIEKVSSIHQDNQFLETYELSIKGKDNIEKGYSGSAVICTKSNQVIAIATDRNINGKEVYAIPLYHLKSLWVDMPKSLLKIKKPYNVKPILFFLVGLTLLTLLISQLPKISSFPNKEKIILQETPTGFTRNNLTEIVIDYNNKLMWQDTVEAKSTQKPLTNKEKPENTASSHCKALSLGNYTNWRLPTKDELIKTIDFNKLKSPFIHRSFQYIYPNAPYWTSTKQTPPENTHAYGIDFHTKANSLFEKKDSYTVRCVRSMD